MKTTKPFGHAVNNAGLPRNWCTVLASGNENLTNFTPQEVATAYWLLESIEVNYAYSINGLHKKRTLTLSADVDPAKRIAIAPAFYHNATDPDGIECTVELELHSISHSQEHSNIFHLNLKVEEQDEDSLFLLTSQNINQSQLIATKTVYFLNRELSINLYSFNTDWPGEIQSFTINPTYYVIES